MSVYKILSVILFFSVQLKAQPNKEKQPGIPYITYTLEYQIDSLDSTSRKDVSMELLIGEGVSLFQAVAKGKWDSLLTLQEKDPNYSPYSDEMIKDVTFPIDYKVYKYQDGTTLIADRYNLFDLGYHIYEEDEMPDWHIEQDTILFRNQFVLQKAVAHHNGREWTAWFCADIPYLDGPYLFQGLPGLIFKVSDAAGGWVFTLDGIGDTQREIVDVTKNEKNKRVEKKGYVEAKRNYRANRTVILENAGHISFESARQRQGSIRRDSKEAKKYNNFIEKP